jgi:septal ring factor EnvC (AmiA/AmiB activator)
MRIRYVFKELSNKRKRAAKVKAINEMKKRLETIDKEIEEANKRLKTVDKSIEKVEGRLDAIEEEIEKIKMNGGIY